MYFVYFINKDMATFIVEVRNDQSSLFLITQLCLYPLTPQVVELPTIDLDPRLIKVPFGFFGYINTGIDILNFDA
jgi:hypothetical protein